MIRKLFIALLAAAALGGCVTSGYGYRGGTGDYYYGRPSVDYYYQGYGYQGYGVPYGYGGIGYGYPYGHGSYYGGYGYPYFRHRPPYYYHPRPPHRPHRPPPSHTGPVTGGNLPAERVSDRIPQRVGQAPRAVGQPGISVGGRVPGRNLDDIRRQGDAVPRVRSPRVESPRVAPPSQQQRMVPPTQQRVVIPSPPRVVRPQTTAPRPRERAAVRPAVSRERDVRQQVER